jgi:hypothetical protein
MVSRFPDGARSASYSWWFFCGFVVVVFIPLGSAGCIFIYIRIFTCNTLFHLENICNTSINIYILLLLVSAAVGIYSQTAVVLVILRLYIYIHTYVYRCKRAQQQRRHGCQGYVLRWRDVKPILKHTQSTERSTARETWTTRTTAAMRNNVSNVSTRPSKPFRHTQQRENTVKITKKKGRRK